MADNAFERLDGPRLLAENTDLRAALRRLIDQVEATDWKRLTSRLDLYRVIHRAEQVLADPTIPDTDGQEADRG